MRQESGQTESRQSDKFKQAALELECNHDEAAFKRSLRAIAKAHVEKKANPPEKPE